MTRYFQALRHFAYCYFPFRSSRTTTTTTVASRSIVVLPPQQPRRQFVSLASLLAAATTTTTSPRSVLACSSSSSTGETTKRTSTTTRRMATSSSPNMDNDNDSSNNNNNNNNNPGTDVGFLDAAAAAALDEELMTQPGFTLEQLMELAGLSVAEAAFQMLSEQSVTNDTTAKKKILIVCGPGNNGGDGLVAARHLYHFGYEPVIVYPKRSSSRQPHYANLVQQCEDLQIPVLEEMPHDDSVLLLQEDYALIIDSIFGFSFKGEPREPFKSILQTMQAVQQGDNDDTTTRVPILAVDVPSGWNVNEGDITGTGWRPDAVISLTAPKACMRTYAGRHFVGGRFLPPALADKYRVRMPPYPGVAQVLEISRGGATKGRRGGGDDNDESWKAGYAAYCADKEAKLANLEKESQEQASSSWEAQYAAHCAEKEAQLAAQDEAEEKALASSSSSPSWEVQYAAYCAAKEAKLVEADQMET